MRSTEGKPESPRDGVCLYRPLTRTLSPAAEGFAEHLATWLSHRPEGGNPVRSRRARAGQP